MSEASPAGAGVLRFVGRRLLLALPTVLGICLITFALIHLAPGEPGAGGAAAGPVPRSAIEARRRLYFLDLPLFFNGDPADLGTRLEGIVSRLTSPVVERRERGHWAAIGCGTLCLPALATAIPAANGQAVEALERAIDGIRRRHPTLAPGAQDRAAWLDAVLPRLGRETIRRQLMRADSSELAWREAEALGTAAIAPAMDVLLSGDPRARRRASGLLSALTGTAGRLGVGSDDEAVLGRWREWWRQHRRDYERFGGARRALARVTETRFAKWIGRVATLSFGHSLHDGRAVGTKLAEALPVTLLLSLLSMGLAYLIAVPWGVYSAVQRGGWFDSVSTTVAFLLYSLPSFWIAMLLILLLGGVGYLDWFPIYGLSSPGLEQATGWTWVVDRLHHLVLPVLCLSYGAVAVISRYQRGAMLEVLRQDYIRMARAKGLSEGTVILKHALRNALLPTITLFGLHFPYLISGSVIIERIFNIPGMGLLTFNAFLQRDYPVIMAVSVISAAMTLGGLILADLLYGLADPRIALTERRGR